MTAVDPSVVPDSATAVTAATGAAVATRVQTINDHCSHVVRNSLFQHEPSHFHLLLRINEMRMWMKTEVRIRIKMTLELRLNKAAPTTAPRPMYLLSMSSRWYRMALACPHVRE